LVDKSIKSSENTVANAQATKPLPIVKNTGDTPENLCPPISLLKSPTNAQYPSIPASSYMTDYCTNTTVINTICATNTGFAITLDQTACLGTFNVAMNVYTLSAGACTGNPPNRLNVTPYLPVLRSGNTFYYNYNILKAAHGAAALANGTFLFKFNYTTQYGSPSTVFYRLAIISPGAC
jgi:hypothetical protein